MSQTRPPVYDDRYAAPVEANRRGAHRARPNAASVTLPVLAGLVVVLVVAGIAWTLLSTPGTPGATATGGATVGAQESPTATPPAAASAAPSGSAGGQPSAPASASTTPPAAGTADRSVHVRLVNTLRVNGLAARLMARLQQRGWTDIETGTGSGSLSGSRVYYGTSADEASARRLAADLGVGTVLKSTSKASRGLVVWIGRDLAGT